MRAPTRRTVKTQDRHVRLSGSHTFPRSPLADPVRYGGFVISTVRRGRVVEEEYSFVEYAPDDFGEQIFEVGKRPDGDFRRVTIGADPATDHCPCDGHKYGYVCRHVGAIRALMAAGKLPTEQV